MTPQIEPTEHAVEDLLGRPLHDLRISVTDRCNFRCTYCMPKEIFGPDFAFLPRSEVLTFEEITRAARAFVELGVEKLRITGGEPLVRRDLPVLIGMLAELRRPDGVTLDLTLTTNGSALRRLAGPLRDAGLERVTVSLDSLDDETFSAMNGVDFPVAKVLDGIAAAREAGLDPIKVNMVVRRGTNETSILPMARWARAEGVTLRFIEYMDVGHTNGWRLDEVVPADEVVAAIDAEMPLERLPARLPRRGRRPVAVRGRRRCRGRGHRVGQPAVLRRLHAGPAVGRRQALHVPVLRGGPRPPGRPAQRRHRRRPARGDRPRLARPRRPLLRAANRGHGRPAAARDVRDGRLTGFPLRHGRPGRRRPVRRGRRAAQACSNGDRRRL